MGSVQIDIHKKEHSLEQKYPLHTSDGVIAFLKNIHYLREARLKGDIDSAILLLDFMDAVKKANLTRREREVLYYRFEKGYSVKETSKLLDISIQSVNVYMKRGATRIANYLAETEGYSNDVF